MAEDSVQNIAKKAAINRATTYVILEKLMGLGLISTYEKGKKTFFVAENPKELLNILNEEKTEIETREKDLKENLNQLIAVYNREKGKPIVRFFEGAEGLEALDRYGRNQLKRNVEIMNFSPFDLIERMFPNRRKTSLNERVRLGIKSRTIYTREQPFSKAEDNDQLRESIILRKEKYPFTASMTIYPEWGIKLYYYGEAKPYGVAIESRELAQNMKLFYQLAWQGAKEESPRK